MTRYCCHSQVVIFSVRTEKRMRTEKSQPARLVIDKKFHSRGGPEKIIQDTYYAGIHFSVRTGNVTRVQKSHANDDSVESCILTPKRTFGVIHSFGTMHFLV